MLADPGKNRQPREEFARPGPRPLVRPKKDWRMRLRWALMLTMAPAWAAAGASLEPPLGAKVSFTLSSSKTYVGAPVRIQVIIQNARQHQPPDFPEIEGADVQELPEDDQRDDRVAWAERQEDLTTTYTYAVIPRQAGTLTIPPIRVTADGETFATSPLHIVAQKSEAGDLLYLRLVGEPESIYLGEALDATLEIWLKPYQANNVRMDAEDTWRYAVDEGASAWGVFLENLQGPTPDVTCRTEARPDGNGQAQDYFVYSLTRRVWPERPGPFDAGHVGVVVNYPLKVRSKRSTVLGRPYEVVESRPISTVVQDSRILVKTPPGEGRPDSFSGAVGQYAMTVTATPTEVSVGDPITLTLTINGTGRMDLLQGPKLADRESLTADFQVLDEEPTVLVSGTVKKSIQRMRAKHAGITEIPPIEFSYFDPQTERYVILQSDPVPLQVKAPTGWAVSPLTSGVGPEAARTELTAVEAGLLANYADLEALLSQQAVSLGWGTWALAVAAPLLYTTCLLARRRHDRLTGDRGLRRRRSARKKALRAIRRAKAHENEPAAVSDIATALIGYVADRCNLPPGSVTRNDAIQQLRLKDVPETLVNQVDGLLVRCEGSQYAAAEHVQANLVAERARACVNELERQKF